MPMKFYGLPKMLLVAALGLPASCAMLFDENDSESNGEPVQKSADKEHAKAPDASAKATPAAKPPSESELKIAKLWARVDELEESQQRMREKLRVLEKGFTLGLIPEELKAHDKEKGAPKSKGSGIGDGGTPGHITGAIEIKPLHGKGADDQHGTVGGGGTNDTKEKPNEQLAKEVSPETDEEYQKMLAGATDQFRAGRYGRAIVEFDAIGKKFGDNAHQGMHRFWIAKSWAALKDYDTARRRFNELISSMPQSPWIPRAKLELARVEWRLGMSDSAVKRLKEVIEQHPHEDAAEMAKMELETLGKKI